MHLLQFVFALQMLLPSLPSLLPLELFLRLPLSFLKFNDLKMNFRSYELFIDLIRGVGDSKFIDEVHQSSGLEILANLIF